MVLFDLIARATDAPAAEQPEEPSADDLLLGDDSWADGDATITREQALSIPAFAKCVGTISDTIASLPVRLYRDDGEAITEVVGDPRTAMLNGDSGDTLSGPEIKRAVVADFLCSSSGGHIVVDKARYSNHVRSLRYVRAEEVSCIDAGPYDPVMKSCVFLIAGRRYEPWQVMRFLRATRDGRTGTSVVEQNARALSVAYETMVYERALVRRAGNKRGYLTAPRKLGKAALDALKSAWRRFFRSSGDNVLVLNDGVQFQEASTTSTEMQLNENKQVNSDDICGIFQMPPEILTSGKTDGASKSARENYSRFCIGPIIAQMEAQYDRCLLLEREKSGPVRYFFRTDLTELTKGDPKERWETHKLKKEAGFETIDEARRAENMPPLGLNYVNLGLNDVLLDPETKLIIIPNMGKSVSLDDLPSGEGQATEGEPAEGGEGDGDQG